MDRGAAIASVLIQLCMCAISPVFVTHGAGLRHFSENRPLQPLETRVRHVGRLVASLDDVFFALPLLRTETPGAVLYVYFKGTSIDSAQRVQPWTLLDNLFGRMADKF
jgi:hypothetical protein